MICRTDPPVHTPYDGSSMPFSIGLKPLDLGGWIEVDQHYEVHLAEKDRLITERPNAVFAAEHGTEAAQAEVRDLVVAAMDGPTVFPGEAERKLYRERRHRFAGTEAEPALQAAARLVQEDLVLMRKGEAGWRLAAASLCFPSSWSLAEKFGRPLADIHGPVPGFGRGTRPAELIERMFDKLQGQAVIRWNWSLQPDPTLHRPRSEHQRANPAETVTQRFAGDDPAAAAFIRVERQTLRKLAGSSDVLFTIRIHLDPMETLRRHEDRAAIAASFAKQLAALDMAQLDYKGLAADRDRLVAALDKIAAG
ncbi:MAG: DUF3445 domain-containing protein [Rhizobiaceae bacterium]|nr:DUF3445 domain-containing protein [Rhizobiaceae bacterium]MCV0406916.1 DUF3445 domain-containing protein [Rhizobiaceae bacterium]